MTSGNAPEVSGCSTCHLYGEAACGCTSGPVQGMQGRVFEQSAGGTRLHELAIFGWAWREDGRQRGA